MLWCQIIALQSFVSAWFANLTRRMSYVQYQPPWHPPNSTPNSGVYNRWIVCFHILHYYIAISIIARNSGMRKSNRVSYSHHPHTCSDTGSVIFTNNLEGRWFLQFWETSKGPMTLSLIGPDTPGFPGRRDASLRVVGIMPHGGMKVHQILSGFNSIWHHHSFRSCHLMSSHVIESYKKPLKTLKNHINHHENERLSSMCLGIPDQRVSSYQLGIPSTSGLWTGRLNPLQLGMVWTRFSAIRFKCPDLPRPYAATLSPYLPVWSGTARV